MLFKEDTAARAQHDAVRKNAGWYKWTHDLVEVKGDDAEVFLNYIFVGNLSKTPVGRTKYTTMLNEDGGIIDDTIIMHMGEDYYWVSTLYAPQLIKWFDKHKADYSVTYADITQKWDMYAVQGPSSTKIMDAMLDTPVDDMKRFSVIDNLLGGIDVKIHRSGFTGEQGYEIYCDIEKTEAVEKLIAEGCKQFDAPEIDILEVYVRSLPVEKGFALRQDMHLLNPYEAGLGWSVDPEKDFIGKEATLRCKEEGPSHLLVGLEYLAESYEDIAQREIVYLSGVEVGFVRAAIYGYTVEKNIGFAVVDAHKVKIGDKVTVGQNHSPALVTEKCWL